MKSGVILASQMVKVEIDRQHDEIQEILEKINPYVIPSKEEQTYVVDLMARPELDKFGISTKHYADPFVVALAKARNLMVITYENPRKDKNSVPVACRLLDVPCGNFVDFLRCEKMQL